MAESLAHPQITTDQLDIWLANPVTKTYLKALGWKRDDQRESAGNGSIVDSSNADFTHAMIHQSLGQQEAYEKAADPKQLLGFYNMIFYPDSEEEEKDGDG